MMRKTLFGKNCTFAQIDKSPFVSSDKQATHLLVPIQTFCLSVLRAEVLQHPRQQRGRAQVSGVSRLFVPVKRLPSVATEGRPGPPSPVGFPHSDPGGGLSARLHPDLRLTGSHRKSASVRVRHTLHTFNPVGSGQFKKPDIAFVSFLFLTNCINSFLIYSFKSNLWNLKSSNKKTTCSLIS